MKKLARYCKGQPNVQKIKFDIDGIGTRHRRFGLGRMCKHEKEHERRVHRGRGHLCEGLVVALSSGEAEHYAAVKGASDTSVSRQVALTWVFGSTGRCRSECQPTAARVKEFVRGQGLARSGTSMLRFSGFRTWFEKSVSR